MSAIDFLLNPKDVTVSIKNGEERFIAVVFMVRASAKKVRLTLNVGTNSTTRIVILCRVLEGGNLILETRQVHTKKAGYSELLCKAAIADASRFCYSGSITIGKSGQQSHAYQRNENLLLSENSYAESEPQLEIEANEVFCTHGSTTSSLSEEQLFFLQSRGLNYHNSEKLLRDGFLLSALDLLRDHSAPQDFETLQKKVIKKII